MNAIIRAIGTANPPRYATQEEVYQLLCASFNLRPRERELYRRVLLEGPIRGRYFGLDADEQARETCPDVLVERFRKFGTRIAVQAARSALEQAGVRPQEVGGLVVNSCTGYLCPGLSTYVAEKLGLAETVQVMDLAGMGCGAAIPNLQCACGLLATRARGPVLSVATEVCSATLFMGPQEDLVISNSLFGDGAAAAVVDVDGDGDRRAKPTDGPPGAAEVRAPSGLVRVVDFETALLPRYREELRYRTEQGRLRNVLSKRVPVIGGRAVQQVALRLLARHGLDVGQIDWWAVHPGGTTVLDQIARKLALPADALRCSYEVLREYGNMSSPSVLFVLKRILDRTRPAPGQRGMLLSFGAGFTAFAALVQTL